MSDNWETAWSSRLIAKYRQTEPVTDLEADSAQRCATTHSMREHYPDKRYAEGSSSYLESLVVADMKFLQDPNSTDYEQYLFTTVNMASDIIRTSTACHMSRKSRGAD
jgi:hypothetical protein